MPARSSPQLPELPSSQWRQSFRRRVRTWYRRHARDLPWRRTRDPYAVWISEIMLQQTQVATVEPYFERFMAAFPTIQALATASEEQVLRLWEGLGYYRRARQMHRAAKLIVEQHGGSFPREAEAVRALPGIGRYTAGAILSLAFDAKEPILEANTIRLFTRLLAFRGDPASAAGSRLLWAMAAAVLPQWDTGSFNQALMELGGQVCTVRQPGCQQCPVATLCFARDQGIECQIPSAKAKKPLVDRNEVAVIIRRRGRLLLIRCPEGGRWAGLWDFPRFQVHSEHEATLRREICQKIEQQTGLTVGLGKHLTTIKHGVTRYRITLDCYEARYVFGPNGNGAVQVMRWLSPPKIADYPLSTTGRKLSRLVAAKPRAK